MSELEVTRNGQEQLTRNTKCDLLAPSIPNNFLSRCARPLRMAGRVACAVAAPGLLTLALPGGAAAQTEPPTVEITWDASEAATAETFDVTFTFSEEVSGFTEGDLLFGEELSIEEFPMVSQGTVFMVTFRTDPSKDQVIFFLRANSVTSVATGTENAVAIPVQIDLLLTNRDALVALYNATGGDSWTDRMNWKTAAPLGEWSGVVTDADGNGTALYLSLFNLSGAIPPALGDLRAVTTLNLGANNG